MKLLALFALLALATAQNTNFVNVWMAGPSTPNGLGNTTAGFLYPSARKQSISWTGPGGNFYWFGGSNSINQYYNDLWSLNSTSQKWTQLNATGTTPSYTLNAAGYPYARAYAMRWEDGVGNVWMFGGQTDLVAGGGLMNDIWFFNATTVVWTYLGGSSTSGSAGTYNNVGATGTPSARRSGTTWVTNNPSGGKLLWLFGGYNYAGNYTNDLWVFATSTKVWTWRTGQQQNGRQVGGLASGVGLQGTPGSLADAVGWVDSTGSAYLYLYGGTGYFNDTGTLWKYDIFGTSWTSAGYSVVPTYGSGEFANPPGVRNGHIALSLAQFGKPEQVYVMHGIINNTFAANDIWLYNSNTNKWRLVTGTSTPNFAGTYTLGVDGSIASIPAKAYYAAWWDSKGQIWTFGGALASGVALSDLWKLNSIDPCVSAICDSAATCTNSRFVCYCNAGFEGDGYSCCNSSITCNGHGMCNSTSYQCMCDAVHNGTNCDKCINNLYGNNCTIFCDPQTNCSGNGFCDVTGECKCSGHFDGVKCDRCADNYYNSTCGAFCNATTSCFGYGSCNTSTGACNCAGNHFGVDCGGCTTNYFGANCTKFCTNATCSSHGYCDGYSGDCICTGHFDGASCERCADNFFGADCENYCDAQGLCNGHGTCNGTGNCFCSGNYTGPTCSDCIDNHYGDTCVGYCTDLETCHSHGSCIYPGICSCNGSYAGDYCDKCIEDQYGENCTQYCAASFTCSGQGTCNNMTGLCDCTGNFAAPDCTKCKPCYHGDNCEIYCEANETCNGNGVCQASDGVCLCSGKFTGIVLLCFLLLLLTQ